MGQIRPLFWLLMAVSISLAAQNPTSAPQAPQTARQALIEMFTGKGENDFKKHLPEDTLHLLIHKGDSEETSTVLKIATIGHQIVAEGGKFETFDEGRILLASEPNQAHEKFEVLVEHDSLLGEEDEIELSFNYYKDGKVQWLPVVPRLTFTFKQEKDVWRLVEINGHAKVPLTDPDYLKGVRKEQDDSNESAARNRVMMMSMAEKGYAGRHPDRGYTCTLSALFAQEPGAMPGEGGFTYDPGQGNEEWSGYHFTLTGCDGNPASKFRVTAVPLDTDAGIKMFCADESGSVRSQTGSKSSSCFSRGEVINGGQQPAAMD